MFLHKFRQKTEMHDNQFKTLFVHCDCLSFRIHSSFMFRIFPSDHKMIGKRTKTHSNRHPFSNLWFSEMFLKEWSSIFERPKR